MPLREEEWTDKKAQEHRRDNAPRLHDIMRWLESEFDNMAFTHAWGRVSFEIAFENGTCTWANVAEQKQKKWK